MLTSKVIVCGVDYRAKRDYIYCYDHNSERVTKYKLTEQDKADIKAHEPDAYDDMHTYRFLADIYERHTDCGSDYNAIKSSISEFYK